MKTQECSVVASRDRDVAVRVAYLVSHPIQYQTPLLRRIAREADIDLKAIFSSDYSVRQFKDKDFGVELKWDVPLLEGFESEVLPTLRDEGAVGFASILNYGLLRRLRARKGERPFDVLWVHGYATVTALQGIVIARLLGIPVLLRAESWLKDRPRTALKRWIKRMFFRGLAPLVKGVLPIGTLNAEYWTYYLGASVPQFLMPYAVDNEYFQTRSRDVDGSRARLQQELNLDPARPVILFASKLQSRKHCDHLISAYAMFSGNASEPVPYLVVVGDGEQRQALEAQAAATGFESIRFCGFRNQSELPAFFDLASVFVLPSQHEPWGMIVNEAMNAGRPVIVSDDVGCQPDLVHDGVEGCVYPVGDVPALTSALHRVLDDPQMTLAMGQRALARIKNWSYDEDIRALRSAVAHITGKIAA